MHFVIVSKNVNLYFNDRKSDTQVSAIEKYSSSVCYPVKKVKK